MLIRPKKNWVWRLLAGSAILMLASTMPPAIASQPSGQNADQESAPEKASPPDAAESAAGEAQDATAQPTEPAAAAPDPDCPQFDVAATDDERHLIDDPYGQAFTGARDGKVKLVMFIDYGCPACR